MIWDTVTPYHRGFAEFTEAYEAHGFEDIHRDVLPFLPKDGGLVLDVGAGSGRDAAWFAGKGWEVLAVEPADGMRQNAARLHPAPHIRWVDDRLPALATVHRLGLACDLVWLSGVWQHIPPDDRGRAMRKLATLLKPGGRMVITLRHGPSPTDRPMWPVDAQEVERLGLDHGLALRVATQRRQDRLGRDDVRWQTVVLDLPDDGAGALPLLRGVILRQEKFSTYKLALLRCVSRIADSSPNMAREAGDDVELPLGLVGLYWLRMYLPLARQDLPQMPVCKLSFLMPGFQQLFSTSVFDLRPGAAFEGDRAMALADAMKRAVKRISDMPARHMTYADGTTPIFRAAPRSGPRIKESLRLDQELLWSYGSIRIPLPVWNAMRRMAAWIEPMLLAEWTQMTKSFAANSDRHVTTDQVYSALNWVEPERDTNFVRRLLGDRFALGKTGECVWSGQHFQTMTGIDVDHCLPWSAWPCSDLWNLLPAASVVNRDQKRAGIVGAAALAAARPRIISWWQDTYLDGPASLRVRFAEEARASLPITAQAGVLDLDEVFSALDFRRLRLRQETGLPQWEGVRVQHGPN